MLKVSPYQISGTRREKTFETASIVDLQIEI